MASASPTPYLNSFPLYDAYSPILAAQGHTFNLEHLLATVADLAEVGEDAAHAAKSPFDTRFRRIKSLLWLANEERERIEAQLQTADHVMNDHIIYKVAA